MSKTTKIWLITATALVTLGAILFAAVMEQYDWDFTKLSTVTYVTNTYEVSDEFDKISINVDTTEIEFVPTENETCSIVSFEAEKVKHSVAVQNGTLIISTVDTRKWWRTCSPARRSGWVWIIWQTRQSWTRWLSG